MDREQVDVVIVGAGAAGLMAARELSKAGKKVILLEARDRIGGRIYPLDENQFGYPAQGGAEFVHGEAPVTKAIMKEASLTYVPDDGELWSSRGGELRKYEGFMEPNGRFKDLLSKKQEDVSIYDFLQRHFAGGEYDTFRYEVLKFVEGYEAADPREVSVASIQDEWLIREVADDGRIKEGYGALLAFLRKEGEDNGVDIQLRKEVTSITLAEKVQIKTADGERYEAGRVVITVPVPLLQSIEFTPALTEKMNALSQIGFGNVIKVVIRFKNRFWDGVAGRDLSRMNFLLCKEKFLTWWTQYPLINSTLVGWMAGPEAALHNDASEEELLELAIVSLANALEMDKALVEEQIETAEVFNWSGDPFTQGAYSYETIHSREASQVVAQPVEGRLFFAGEALYSGGPTATVEGALASGLEIAQEILRA